MEDSVQRMIDEHTELRSKLKDLTAFIGTDQFKKLNVERRRLLEQQHELMVLYVNVLEQRISLELGEIYPPEETEEETSPEA